MELTLYINYINELFIIYLLRLHTSELENVINNQHIV